jgi:tripartite-type tricarboxylate transporter receptor subunit TctC
MITRRSVLAAPALAGLFARAVGPAQAQDFPSGPVTIMVSFPAGGSIDVVMRAIAPNLQERLGKPVVIENRAGAGGVIATAAVVKSPPDGQTLLASASSLASNPALFKSLPFDTLKDLQSVSLVFRTPLALVVNPDLPVKSVADLVALLKQKPDAVNYAHGGPGSAIHLAAELFKTMTGTAMNGVAYRGAPLALNDVMANHVALMFADAGSVIGLIKSGKVRALGVSSLTRVPALPDVPTIAEAGVAGFDAVGWTMVSVPAATPPSIVSRLNAEINAVAATPEVRNVMISLGAIPAPATSPTEVQKFLADEIGRWGSIIEKAGVAKSL